MNVRFAPLAWGIVSAAIGLLLLAPRSSYQPGTLLAAHQQLSSNCTACHRPWRGPSNAGCVNCHGDISDSNPHSGFDVRLKDVGLIAGHSIAMSSSHNLECLSCHTEHRGAAPNVSASSAVACVWCHKHPSIDKVAEHQVPEMQRQFFVRHLFKRRFNHYEHELLIKSHYPPIAGGFSCMSCHLVPPSQPGGREQMSFKWGGCAGVGCHLVPQDSFMEMPAALGRSPVTIPYSGIVPVRHIKAVFLHSAGHLQSACEQCHFKVAASRDPDDRASLAITQCFQCHAHQPPAPQKSAERQSAVLQQTTGAAQLSAGAPVSVRIDAGRPPPSLPLVRGRDSEAPPKAEVDSCSVATPQHFERRVFSLPLAVERIFGSAHPVFRFSDRPLTPARDENPIPPPDQGEVRRELSDSQRFKYRLRTFGNCDESAVADEDPASWNLKGGAFAATALASELNRGRPADRGRTVVACNECHLFHAYGVVPTLDFPDRAPNLPPNQARRFELIVYVPHSSWSRGDTQFGPLPLRPMVFSPWWLGLVAIGFVAYRFGRYVGKLPQKRTSDEAVPDVAPQRSKEVPALDDTYQTSVRHLYIVGEAAGTASINLAMRSGRQVIEAIVNELHHSAPQVRPDLFDVVIVGCGPAGLGATATAKVLGLKYATLEKLTPASTLRSYPRAKFVQATPIDIAEYGSFFLEGDNSREELIKEWEKIIAKLGLVINDREEVAGVVREQDYLVVKTARGNSYPARCVVLAIGVRGNPRHLNLEGEVSARVLYSLIEPDEFTGRKILVVGGGNAGSETTQALAAARLGNTVSYSFRSPVLTNVNRENADAITALQMAKAITLYPATALAEIRPNSAVLEPVKSAARPPAIQAAAVRPVEIENDIIFAMIGAELPTAFLRSIGIKLVSKGRLYG